MKTGKIKQMILCVLSGALCSIQILECYPLVPAYFVALYMEEVKTGWLFATTYAGMLLFMPITAVVKYSVILVVAVGIVKLVQWATDGCPAYLIGMMTALATMIVSFCGGLLEWRNQPIWQAVLLEGVFVLGAVILLSRAVHMILEWKWELPHTETKFPKQESRLRGYAESFEGL